MTVALAYAPESFAPQSKAKSYKFDMESTGLSSIEVYEIYADDVRLLLPASRYTIEFSGTQPIFDGGNLLITNGPRAGTESIVIERNTIITQLVDFNRVKKFTPDILEFTLDKATMILQEINKRKCGDEIPDIFQTIDLFPYGPFGATILNDALTLLVDTIKAMEAAKDDCSCDPELT
jgi:hypothetical protein